MKKLLIAGLCLTASIASYAQGPKVNSAANLTAEYLADPKDKKSLEEAYLDVKAATTFESTKDDNKCWYYMGYINQLMFQDSVLRPKYQLALFESSKAYQNVIILTEKPDGKKKFLDESYANMVILTAQLHNFGYEELQKKGQEQLAYDALKELLSLYDFLSARNQQGRVKVKIDDSRLLFASAATSLKKTDEAKAIYQKLIDNKYKNMYVYKTYAGLLVQTKDTAKALDILNQGSAIYPDSVSLNIDRINIYISGGRQAEALDIMNKAIAQEPRNAQLYAVLGNTYGILKDNDKAITAYKKAIELDPKSSDSYTNIGAIYVDSANALVDKMADPKLKDAEFNKMKDQYLAHFKQALPYLEKAAELRPESLSILDALKTIYAKMNDYDKVNEVKKKMDALKAKSK